MNIISIPNTTINGQNVYPYSIDYTNGGAEASEISLSFVNKDGDYNIPATDSTRPVTINIGNFRSIDAFVVETTTTSAPNGGKILHITYIDSSIILDKTVVGLRGVHGAGFTSAVTGNFSSDIVLVGSQIDPCQNVTNTPTDPCAPACDSNQGERQNFDCNKERLIKILQVDYSFPELKAALTSRISFGSFPESINSEYRASYTGTVREVLQNWCADFGIGFYWESNSVYFYDLSRGITINVSGLDTGVNVTNYTETKSIRDNSAKAKVVYFGTDGEERNYSCSSSNSRTVVLKPVTLYDLLSDEPRPNPDGTTSPSPADTYLKKNYDPHIKSSKTALENFYDAIVLSYYSGILRDLYFLYEKEGLVDAKAFETWIKNPKKKSIPALGNLKPTIVLSSDSENKTYLDIYKKLLGRKKAEDGLKFKKKKGFFIVASWEKDAQEKLEKLETSLAENFIGQYWIRPFADGTRYSFDAPDGTVDYYSNGSDIQFPFLNDLPEDIQKSSDFLQDLIESSQESEPGVITSTQAHGKFLMMKRTGLWSPARNSTVMEKVLNTVRPYRMIELGKEDIDGANLTGSEATSIFAENDDYTIFEVYPKPEKLDLKITKGQTQSDRNPLDSKNTNLSSERDGAATPYGLLSSETQYFIIKTAGSNLQIHLPSQAGARFGSNYGGYRVIANSDNSTSEYNIVLVKKEVILGDSITTSNKDIATELIFEDATQNLIEFLESSGTNTCGYSDNAIRQLLFKFNARQKMFASIERIEKKYDISGIPTKSFSASDGLQSFTINVSESGLRSSVSFSNLPPQSKSDSILEKDFQKNAAILGKAKNYFRKS